MSHHSARVCAEGGFVRFPRSYLHLPISPGAKVVLMHLCGAANDDGESWYCYEDIAELVGRSKASITAYVNELVALDLVSSIKQTMANGYNYRRRLKIVGWKDLVAYWASLSKPRTRPRRGPEAPFSKDTSGVQPAPRTGSASAPCPSGSAPDIESSTPRTPTAATHMDESSSARTASSSSNSERSDQPAERTDPSGLKTKIHQNKTPRRLAPPVVWSEDDEKAWKQFRPSDRDPITNSQRPLTPMLADRVRIAEKTLTDRLDLLSREARHKLASSWLTAFASQRGLDTRQEEIEACAATVSLESHTRADVNALFEALEKGWKPHWKRLSSPAQIKALAKSTSAGASTAEKADIALLSTLRHRVWICSFHLSPEPG